MKIIWCMVRGIWSATDRIMSHLGPFLPFYPPHNQENWSCENMKKTSGYIIILHICTINNNHMYSSWDMKHNRHNFYHFQPFFALLHFLPFLSFSAIFCPNSPKNQLKKRLKKIPGDIILHMCTKIYDQMMYGS